MDPHAPTPHDLGVGMVGYAFMGAAHSQAWRTAPRFFDLPLRPGDDARCAAVTRTGSPRPPTRLGWESTETDWRRLVDARRHRPRRHLHAGRHPRRDRRSPRSRPASTCCARSRWPTRSPRPRRWPRPPSGPPQRGVRSMVGVHLPPGPGDRAGPPAGRRRGGSATIRHVRAQYLQDWLVGPVVPAGLAAARRTGPARVRSATSAPTSSTSPSTSPATAIAGVTGLLETFVQQRPLADRAAAAARGWPPTARPGRSGEVTVDDAAAVPRAVRSAAHSGVFEATRFATGRKNAIRLEINGSAGSLAFDFEDMNVLQFYDAPRSRPRRPASAGSWSPSRATRTSAPGGRPATAWATSTASPTRWSTW